MHGLPFIRQPMLPVRRIAFYELYHFIGMRSRLMLSPLGIPACFDPNSTFTRMDPTMSSQKKLNLTLIGLAAICFAFLQNGANIVSPLMANILADFPGEAPTSVIMIQTLPSLGMVCGSLLYGALTRKVSNRIILVLASSLYIFASILPVLLDHLLIPILIVRICMGLGCGLFAAMSVALIAGNFNEKRSANFMGYLVFAQSVAMIVFQTGAGFLGVSNWRYALFLGLLCIPVLVIGLCTLPQESRTERMHDAEQRMLLKKEIKALSFFTKYPPIFFAWCIEALFFFAGIFVLFVNTSIMIETSDFGDAWDAVLVLNVHTGSGLVFSLIFGKLYERIKDYLLFLACFVASLACLCFVLAQNTLWMCVGAGLLGFSVPSFMAALYQMVGKRIDPLVSATATSVLVAFQQMGGLLMVSIVQPLCGLFSLDFEGGRDPFLIYAVIYLLIAIAVFFQAHFLQGKISDTRY